MSDFNSADTPPRPNARRIRRTNRSNHEPLLGATGDPIIDRQSQLQLVEDLVLLFRLLDTAERHEPAPPAGTMTTPPTSGDNAAAVPVPAQRGPKKPVITLVSMLPKTIYNEADEAEGTVRVPPYVRVQRQLLYYLGLHASDTLTPRQARRWTEDIADNKQPQAKDALRLCYYMRSQGFDTYADIRGSFMSLYIANQKTDVRGPRTDHLYWKQSFKNNAIEPTAPSVSTVARGVRRNAFALADATPRELLAHLAVLDSQEAQIEVSFTIAGQPGNGEGEGSLADAVSGDGAEQEDDQEQDGHQAQDSLAARIAGATAELETLLLSNSPDTRAIDAAIARIEQLSS